MNVFEELDVIERMVHCCFSKGRCLDYPFYEMPNNGHPGKCLGHKKIGPLLEMYLKDIRNKLKEKDGKDEKGKAGRASA